MWTSKKCLWDPVYLSFLKSESLLNKFGGAFDGNVYEKETFSCMAQCIINSFDFEKATDCTWEEVLFPTWCMNRLATDEIAFIDLTYMNWENGLAVYLYDFSRPNFAVKRIPRIYADYRRVYARKKLGYGNEVAAVLQCNKDWQPCVLLWGYELAYRCKRSIGHFLRRLK